MFVVHRLWIEGTDESHENFLIGYPVSQPGFQLHTSLNVVRCVVSLLMSDGQERYLYNTSLFK